MQTSVDGSSESLGVIAWRLRAAERRWVELRNSEWIPDLVWSGSIRVKMPFLPVCCEAAEYGSAVLFFAPVLSIPNLQSVQQLPANARDQIRGRMPLLKLGQVMAAGMKTVRYFSFSDAVSCILVYGATARTAEVQRKHLLRALLLLATSVRVGAIKYVDVGDTEAFVRVGVSASFRAARHCADVDAVDLGQRSCAHRRPPGGAVGEPRSTAGAEQAVPLGDHTDDGGGGGGGHGGAPAASAGSRTVRVRGSLEARVDAMARIGRAAVSGGDAAFVEAMELGRRVGLAPETLAEGVQIHARAVAQCAREAADTEIDDDSTSVAERDWGADDSATGEDSGVMCAASTGGDASSQELARFRAVAQCARSCGACDSDIACLGVRHLSGYDGRREANTDTCASDASSLIDIEHGRSVEAEHSSEGWRTPPITVDSSSAASDGSNTSRSSAPHTPNTHGGQPTRRRAPSASSGSSTDGVSLRDNRASVAPLC